MYDSKYDSKMHDITIPLMGFNGFHHAGNKDDFENFIGRESILDKLKSWLVDGSSNDSNNNYSGAYLITGFRGMGKSAFVHKTIRDIQEDEEKKNHHYVPIPINVGNDMLTSKELLYIICKLLSAKFDEETRLFNSDEKCFSSIKWQEQGFWSTFNVLVGRGILFIIGLLLLWWGLKTSVSSDNGLSCLGSVIKTKTATISDFIFNYGDFDFTVPHLIIILLGICLLITAFFFIHRLYYRIWNLTGCNEFITIWQIKRTFRHLNERIDSEMTESNEFGIDSSKNAKPFDVVPGLRLFKNKKNVYPIAQTTEIQDLLVKQLSLINKLPKTKFRFVFIIDELDKVSPEDYEKEIIPEYNSANVINGNSTYHSRQKAFVGLLANMKYFISSSEAKFIFITGYDMYEATLADISNREFNLHSIFNGYINVSSFLRKTGSSKGADSLIEEYFCHLIMRPEDSERRNDLRDYANFFQSQWGKNNPKFKRYELLLDRRITFLRHFLTYLFYMSNGSPKKLAIYLEKYVRSRQRIEEQYELKHQDNLEEEYDDLSLGVDSYWEDCGWFLYFDVRNIQKIEFINYLIYPMIKNLIAKSSTYNDKLLVATSFMISNLYKFHKSGFSWRNLEYMPELLDINKMPELRDFIGGILQFLNQTHIDEAVANLYKFKFPQRLSEEITFYSKTAEEVSYLFNFSHDELLSIKTLYNRQLEHYSANKHYESPAIASLHQLLGDIYMLEENYEQAIFEFNEALDAIRRQERAVVKDFKEQKGTKDVYFNLDDDSRAIKDSSKILFKIRVTLKLGLAYEKRKTFDTAYIIYENLTRMLLEIASKISLVQKEKTLEKPSHYRPEVLRHLDSNATLFSNIRLSYLSILAKVAVLEKMDLGGIRENDLWRQIQEFGLIEDKLQGEMRSVVNMDFYTKLGVILFYKNGMGNEVFLNQLRGVLKLTTQTDSIKYDDCRKCSMKYQRTSYFSDTHPGEDCLTPCLACQYYNKGLKTCMEELGGYIPDYERASKAVFFLQQFLDDKSLMTIRKKGDLFVMAMSNALLGMGNTLLGCGKVKDGDISDYFTVLRGICDNLAADEKTTYSFDRIQDRHLSPFTKSFLYYLAAAESYKMLTDYKAAYNIYIQVLDAVAVYYHINNSSVPNEALNFCERITKNAIHCAYLHYDSINCAEVDTQKHELGKSYIDYINLHSLTDFPEIEIAIDKYYRIQLMGADSERDKVLKNLLKSRQLGSYKLISTLTQGIQNLCLKVDVNKEILSRILTESNVRKLFDDLELDCQQTIQWIVDYYHGRLGQDVNKLIKDLDWGLFSNTEETMADENRFILLDYLLKDSLFCLNMITEFIEPLYSTTLYNNAFVGDIYRKTFVWDHILIAVRELFEYAESDNKDEAFRYFKHRYSKRKLDLGQDVFKTCADYFESLQSWDGYSSNGKSRVENIYMKASPGGGNFQTSSYLSETAIDRFSKSIEMHTSGKAYKEMMTTLFFLEDDLQNDSNYMNLAIERFLINHGYVQDRMNQLKAHGIRKTSLLSIENYVKQ